jgi:hypothetical protein
MPSFLAPVIMSAVSKIKGRCSKARSSELKEMGMNHGLFVNLTIALNFK